MLTLTENAQVAIRTIASEAGLPDSGGVRITMADAGDQFEMSLAPEPALSDAVIEADGARVFVPEDTATLLAEQELDAGLTPDGTGFSLRQQI
ncbi:MAG: hypothetical protein JJE50_13695 [Actinomycetales bacterium]|nr:hypothetical protein [Actinomycetales bacterium]